MDEPAMRVLHRFKHGEFGFIFITLFKQKNVKIRVKFVRDVDGKYGKNIGFPYWSQNQSDTVLKG